MQNNLTDSEVVRELSLLWQGTNLSNRKRFRNVLDFYYHDEDCAAAIINRLQEKVDGQHMKCPFCDFIFYLSSKELAANDNYECPRCYQTNLGSRTSDNNGILRGLANLGGSKGKQK